MRTIRAMYEREADAAAARQWLVSHGVEPQRVSLIDRTRPGRVASLEGGKSRGLWANLKEMVALPDGDKPSFDDHLNHGGYLLTASVPEDKLTGAIAILEKSGVVDFDPATTNEERIPIVEERLQVGRELTEGDSVHVRSFAAERPVHERVLLHDYRVSVARRSLDRPVGETTPAAALEELFKERDIELIETSEEVVFEKQARVREEVVVRKEAHERVEHIDTTLRHTEIEVERIAEAGTAGSNPAVAR